MASNESLRRNMARLSINERSSIKAAYDLLNKAAAMAQRGIQVSATNQRESRVAESTPAPRMQFTSRRILNTLVTPPPPPPITVTRRISPVPTPASAPAPAPTPSLVSPVSNSNTENNTTIAREPSPKRPYTYSKLSYQPSSVEFFGNTNSNDLPPSVKTTGVIGYIFPIATPLTEGHFVVAKESAPSDGVLGPPSEGNLGLIKDKRYVRNGAVLKERYLVKSMVNPDTPPSLYNEDQLRLAPPSPWPMKEYIGEVFGAVNRFRNDNGKYNYYNPFFVAIDTSYPDTSIEDMGKLLPRNMRIPSLEEIERMPAGDDKTLLMFLPSWRRLQETARGKYKDFLSKVYKIQSPTSHSPSAFTMLIDESLLPQMPYSPPFVPSHMLAHYIPESGGIGEETRNGQRVIRTTSEYTSPALLYGIRQLLIDPTKFTRLSRNELEEYIDAVQAGMHIPAGLDQAARALPADKRILHAMQKIMTHPLTMHLNPWMSKMKHVVVEPVGETNLPNNDPSKWKYRVVLKNPADILYVIDKQFLDRVFIEARRLAFSR
jgi:hypothetical protein